MEVLLNLPQLMIFPVILLIIGYFCLGTAINCGGNQVAKSLTIDQRGKGDFKTIQAGIDSVKRNNDQWVKIHIKSGIYMEKVSIPKEKPCIILEGDNSHKTIITCNDHRLTTSWGATFVSTAPNVIVSGITFKNSFNLVRGNLPGTRTKIEPAAAAVVYGDQSYFYKCSFLGYQDTLMAANGRHYFKDCYIQGEVDFIAGAGQSYFKNCTINARLGNSTPPGFITAQRRSSLDDPSGFVFEGGFVVGTDEVNLGRAWGPYSRVIFHRTIFSSVVSPEGWNAWDFRGHEDKFTYAEVDCTGPGANTSKRVKWEKKLNPSQLQEYSLSSFINKDKWLAKIPTIFL